MTRLKQLGVLAGLTTCVVIGALILTQQSPSNNAITGNAMSADQQNPLPAKASATAATANEPSQETAGSAKALAVEALQPEQITVGDNPEYPNLEMRLIEMEARREGQTFDPQHVLAAMQQPTAWTVDESIADRLPISDEDRYDGRTFIQFSPLKVETLMPGDTLEVPIPQINRSFEMVVENVQSHNDGTVTWRGRLRDFESDNQVIITQGPGVTSAGVFTPEESFTLEAHGNAGWIVNTGTLFKSEAPPIEAPPNDLPSSAHHESHDPGQEHHH